MRDPTPPQPVVGRKNWLFAGSEGGAQAAATLFALVGSCRLQGVDPHPYLVDVLGRVQDCKQPKSLTPSAWRLARSHTGSGLAGAPLAEWIPAVMR